MRKIVQRRFEALIYQLTTTEEDRCLLTNQNACIQRLKVANRAGEERSVVLENTTMVGGRPWFSTVGNRRRSERRCSTADSTNPPKISNNPVSHNRLTFSASAKLIGTAAMVSRSYYPTTKEPKRFLSNAQRQGGKGCTSRYSGCSTKGACDSWGFRGTHTASQLKLISLSVGLCHTGDLCLSTPCTQPHPLPPTATSEPAPQDTKSSCAMPRARELNGSNYRKIRF